MMNIELIDGIASGLTQNIGATFIAAIFFFIAAMFLFNIVLGLEPMFAVLLASVPFVMMITLLSFYVSWALGILTLAIGFFLTIALFRMFLR